MSHQPDEHEFDGTNEQDGLTPEERAALAGDEDQGALPVRDYEREFPQTANDPDAARAAAEAAGRDDGADPGDAGDGDAPPVEEAAPTHRPLLVADLPADADEQLKSIKDEKSALLEQLDEGDLTAREYHAKLEELNERQRKIELAQHEAGLAEKMERQRLQTEWETTVHAFLSQNPEWKKDADPVRFNALDQRIREIATSEEGAKLSNIQILTQARDDLVRAFGAPAQAKPQPNGLAEVPGGKQRVQPPPTLARVPAADVSETSDSQFAALDRLADTDPMAYEDAIAKLDPQTLDRYMAAR